MAELQTPTVEPPLSKPLRLNVADRLHDAAAERPAAVAVACPHSWSPTYRRRRIGEQGDYATTTFAELDADASRIARGLIAWGVPPGARFALLVRPGIEFVTLVFALLRAGMVIVLVDPGLGKRNLVRCLSEAEPAGFVAIGLAQAIRSVLRHKFPRAKWNVTVGRRWLWSGISLSQLRELDESKESALVKSALPAPCSVLLATQANDPAAIIFTSGSTGPPKGVLYTHRMFDTQVAEIQSAYGIKPGGIDLGCFPLFALFNSAMGVTTVFPDMDFSRPAQADPKKLLAAANDWQVTQAFASPAVWRLVGDYCAQTGARIDSLRQVFSCGAPVPASVIRSTLACVAPDAKMHTPYGATECLPVATIEASEVLNETAAKTDAGAGVCVGRKFDSIDWGVIRITDEPIATIDDAEELPPGEIGELIVRGPQASERYVTRLDENPKSKISARQIADCELRIADFRNNPQPPAPSPQPPAIWHRMGDVGYLDAEGRFWYCGRKSHRVETTTGTLFTECVEGVVNTLPQVRRCALVGIGPADAQTPVLIIEFADSWSDSAWDELYQHVSTHKQSACIDRFLVVTWPLPVDVRHNAKINREWLAAWAVKHLARCTSQPPAPSPQPRAPSL